MLDERYGKDYKNPKDMSPIQRLIHFKSPTTQKYNSEKLGELLSLQASAQVSEPDSLPQKFHDAQRNNIVTNEIKIPKT